MFQRLHCVGVLALLACIVATGCSPLAPAPVPLPMRVVSEIPGANLPVDMRPKNWTDRAGSGSCVIASNCHNLLWVNMPAEAAEWRRTYAGGQTDSSIRQKCDANRLGYFYTRSADMEFLRWVSDTRRSALIWYYPRHCVNFCGFHRDPSTPHDPTVFAWLCDNNRPSRFIRVPVDQFQTRWANYGGFALSLAAPPVPPPFFHALGSQS